MNNEWKKILLKSKEEKSKRLIKKIKILILCRMFY